MKRFFAFSAISALVFCLSIPQAAISANLVVNGDFEQGNPSPGDTPLGYSQSGNPSSTGISIGAAQSGNTAYDFGGSQTGGFGFLSQAIATTPGQEYQLNYYLFIPGGSPTEFLVNVGGDASSGTLVGGTTLFDLINPLTTDNSSSFPADYALMTADFTATSDSTNLNFGAFNNPSFFLLDNISVATVPEPSSLILFGLGAAALYIATWRQRNS
jgi:PEP-CTERM motif